MYWFTESTEKVELEYSLRHMFAKVSLLDGDGNEKNLFHLNVVDNGADTLYSQEVDEQTEDLFNLIIEEMYKITYILVGEDIKADILLQGYEGIGVRVTVKTRGVKSTALFSRPAPGFDFHEQDAPEWNRRIMGYEFQPGNPLMNAMSPSRIREHILVEDVITESLFELAASHAEAGLEMAR